MKLKPSRLAVVLLGDRLTAAVVDSDRVEAFTVDAENPAAALRGELDARKLTLRATRVGLARASVAVKAIELPAVAGEMRDMVRFELDRHLPFPADDAPFDFVPLPADAEGPRPGATGQRVLVAAADRRVVDMALRLLEDARLRPVSITVAAHDLLALAQPPRGQRLVWVHRAGGVVDLLFCVGPALVLSRTIPGGDAALIADEVRKSLMAVRWKTCDGLWVSGDLDPGDEALGELGVPVTAPAYTPRAAARLQSLPPESRADYELAVAVASGRRLRPLDLLPENLRPRRFTRGQRITMAVAAVALVLGLTALLVPGLREQRHLGRIDTEIARIEGDVKAVERVVRELDRKKKLLATIQGLETNALRPLPVLRDLTELLPNDAWLTTLTLDTKGVELTGQAGAASTLIPLLENSPRLERVEFSSPVTRGRDREQFRIRASWEPGGAGAHVTPVAVAPPPASGATTPPQPPRPRPTGPGLPSAAPAPRGTPGPGATAPPAPSAAPVPTSEHPAAAPGVPAPTPGARPGSVRP